MQRFGTPPLVLLLHRDRTLRQNLAKVREVVDQHGQAGFAAYGRWGRRHCYRLRNSLTDGYQVMVEEPNPEGGGPGARLRWRRFQTRLWVTRIGGPDRTPRHEDPHQRALRSLNRPAPPEEDATGR